MMATMVLLRCGAEDETPIGEPTGRVFTGSVVAMNVPPISAEPPRFHCLELQVETDPETNGRAYVIDENGEWGLPFHFTRCLSSPTRNGSCAVEECPGHPNYSTRGLWVRLRDKGLLVGRYEVSVSLDGLVAKLGDTGEWNGCDRDRCWSSGVRVEFGYWHWVEFATYPPFRGKGVTLGIDGVAAAWAPSIEEGQEIRVEIRNMADLWTHAVDVTLGSMADR